jgi:SAM-dependent methyltransferase
MLSSWMSIPSRVYRRLRGGATSPERIHEYYARRTDSDAQLRQEVLFAVACGREYAENIVRELGRPNEPMPDLSSLSVLELGPGINFGASLVCAMLGARVAVFDKYLVEWHEAYHPRFYRLLRAELAASDQQLDLRVLDQVIAANCHPDGVIETGRGDLGAGRIDLETGSFDAIVSNAALEHVADVPKLCSELWRVTRPGGVGIHQIDFRDHSNDGRPLDFLAVPDDKYARTFACGQGGGGNRVRPSEFRAAFREAGFDVIRFEPNCFADGAYVEAVRPSLLQRYASLSVEELRVVGGRIFLKRQGGTYERHATVS